MCKFDKTHTNTQPINFSFLMMNSEEFLDRNKKIQNELLNFIRNDENDTENMQNLQTLFNELNIRNDKHDLTTILHLILLLY